MTAAPERSGAFRLIAEQRRHQPDVVRLARSLCLAAQAEPYFLRGARLRFAPDSATGLEARLSFSPLVEAADSRALVLYPEVSAALRQELYVHDPRLLGSVRDFTLSAHRCAPPLVRGFEELLWTATVGPPPAEAEVERTLTPLFRQVLAQGAAAAEASRWILHFLPRLPQAVRDSLPAWRLRVMAAERLGMEPPPGLVSRADAEEIRTVRTLVHTDVDIGVRAEPDGLTLSRPPERDALVLGASGAGRVRLRLRGALPGAAWHDLDLYDGEHTTLGVGVAAEARADGTLLAAQAELGGTLLCARAGHRAAVATTAEGRTVLRLDDGESVLSVELPAEPQLLAVADAGPPATAVVGDKGLHVVTTAVDGSADAVLHPLAVRPAAVGWSRTADRGVLCLARGNEVLLVDDGDPGRILGTLTHPAPVLRLWCSVRAGLVAAADAEGGVTVHHLTAPPETRTVRRPPGPEITALAGDPGSGAVVWATADGRLHGTTSAAPATTEQAHGTTENDPDAAVPGRVHGPTEDDPGAATGQADGTAESDPDAVTTEQAHSTTEADPDAAVTGLGRLSVPAVSVALLADAGLVVVADGGERLLCLDWPGGGPVTAVPMPFRVQEVHPATGDLLLLSGRGGEVEIRAEDGRTHLLTPAPMPPSPHRAGPDWLRDSLGVVVRARDPGLTAGIRRWGIGHVCLPASLPPGAQEFTALLTRARQEGLRVLAELAPPDGHSAHGELLRRAYDLLEEPVDGLRLREADRWPAPLLTRLRHLLDAYPESALVTEGAADPALGTAHLTLGPPPPPPPAAPPTSYGTWALPDTAPGPRTCLLLALPGCHEIPAASLTAPGLRPLLAARAAQLALRHGTLASVPTGTDSVTAVRRDHAGQTVLCLTSTADDQLTARISLPDTTEGTELTEIARDTPDPPPDDPAVLRPSADGAFTVRLDPGRTRWFRVRTDAHPPPEDTDPFAPPAR